MLALLAGLAEMSPAARAAAVYDPESLHGHGVPSGRAGAVTLLQVLGRRARGSPCSPGGEQQLLSTASCDADQVVAYSRHAGRTDVANTGTAEARVSWTSCC
jgi:hypothetical protein